MIACVGDNCVDYYDLTGEAFPGGNPVNVAVYVRRMGGESCYIGAVGTDEYGAMLVNALKGKEVAVDRVHVLPGATALSHVQLIEGERVFGDYDEGVMADFKLTEDDKTYLKSCELLVSGLWGHAENDLQDIAAAGVPVAFDCAERPEDEAAQTALPHTTVAFFSDDASSDADLRKRVQRVYDKGAKVVVATRGGKGSLAYDGTTFYDHGIVKCPVVDTMGAGDSFIAGFLMAYLRGETIPDCMTSGANSSAITLGYQGAW